MLAFALIIPTFCVGQSPDSQEQIGQFKIHNEVFVGDRSLAASINLTLFQGNNVFDFRYLADGKTVDEITIFDAQDRSFALLDVKRKIRLKVDNLQLLKYLEGMRKELTKSPKVAHLLFADASEKFDETTNSIQVSSSRIKYDVIGKRPEQDQVLAEYLRFLDNYTLLGATDPMRMPPFARIELNRSIKKFGILPMTVELTIYDPDGVTVEVTANSKHRLEPQLSIEDQKLIDLARKYWVEFERVGITRYRSIEVADGKPESEAGKPK